jgi:hypothetical protein
MGINTHCYCYWGVKTIWSEEFSDANEEMYEATVAKHGHGKPFPADSEVDYMSDDMGGEYMVFGVQLWDSGDARWGEMVNETQTEINGEILETWRAEYIEHFKSLHPDLVHLVDVPWKLINFVHYS